MNIQAQLADGTILEFPEGTDQAVIDNVVKQHIGGQPKQPVDESQMTNIPIPYEMAAPGAKNVDYGDTYGPLLSGIRAFGRGAMLGYGDEIGGAVKGYIPALLSGQDPQAEYTRIRDQFRAQDKKEAAKNPVATTAGNIAGQVNTGVVSSLLTGGQSVPAIAGLGALQGAATGYGESEAKTGKAQAMDALEGGAWGLGGSLVGAGAGKVLGSIISPKVAPEVQQLMDAGITPTPGQIIGKGAAKLEDKLTSIPGLGYMVSGAQTRALDQFNNVALNKALQPIGGQVDDIGRAGVEAVKKQLGDAYDNLLPKLTYQADDIFVQDLNKITQMAKEMPKPQATRFAQIIRDKVASRLGQNGAVDGRTFKGIESELNRIAKGYGSSPSVDERELGSAVREVLSSLRANLIRVNPQVAPELQAINRGYAQYAILRDAAGRVGSDAGVFTPAQLQSAVRAADKSVGKGNFATGKALGQDLSEAGKKVLGAKYPDSGTAGRVIAGWLGLGGAGALDLGTTATTLGLGSLPYTKIGQKAAAALLTKRPQGAQELAQIVRAAAPSLGLGGALGLLGLGGS